MPTLRLSTERTRQIIRYRATISLKHITFLSHIKEHILIYQYAIFDRKNSTVKSCVSAVTLNIRTIKQTQT